MRGSILLLPFSLLFFWETSSAPIKNGKLNNRPIIAVLAQRYPNTSNRSYIAASYVKYLESAGARVVPIPHYFTKSKIKTVFTHLNGVLFPGGAADLMTSDIYKNAEQFWDMTREANNGGNYFPMWGTCLGFQIFFDVLMKKNILIPRPSDDVALPLKFTESARHSRLFKDMDSKLYEVLGTESLTFNHHVDGVTPETYKANKELREFFDILSLNKDVNGKEFISTVEAYKYPIYGVQWHPEKANFEFTTKLKNIPHSDNAVLVTQYLANFFVNEARKNFHKFPTKEMEDEYLIYKHKPIYSALKYKTGGLSYFEQIYLF